MSRAATYGEILQGLKAVSTSARIEYKLEGNWHSVASFIDNLPMRISNAAFKGQQVAASRFYDMLMDAFNSGGAGYNWIPLKLSYKEWKVGKGFDPKMMSMTHTYRDSIEIVKNRSSKNVYVQIDPNAVNPVTGKHGFTVAEYARVLETGSIIRGIEARPLWSPTLKKFGGRKAFGRITGQYIQQELRLTAPPEVRIT